VNSVRNLLIDTPSGSQVRLGDIADVSIKDSPSVIQRDAVSRYIDVTAGVSGRSRSAVLTDVKNRMQDVKFPLEYRYELVSNYAERSAIQHRLMLVGAAIAIGTFLLLQAAFANWRLAILLFVTLPLALVGAAVVELIGGGNVELGSVCAFLAVFAIATRNGVSLLRSFQRVEHDGKGHGRELVLQAARDGMRPIVTTAVATAMFFAPFALLGNRPGHEIVSPMGDAVLGGLLTSTVVSLFLLPALYVRFASGRAGAEDLDLRELWEERPVEELAPEPALESGTELDDELAGAWPS
jgi:Cu/Ag efflux pump CusA